MILAYIGLWGEDHFAIIYRNHMDSMRPSIPKLEKAVSCVRWRWVFVAGVGVGIFTPILAVLAINAYAAALRTGLFFSGGGAPQIGHIETLGYVMGVWGTPVLHLLLTVLAASLVARRLGYAEIRHGILLGVVSVIVSQAIGLYYGPVILGELGAFIFLGIGGGLLGGVEGRSARAGQEALYEASRHISAARSPEDIVAAIGENLADPKTICVALWEVTPRDGEEDPERLALRAAWEPQGGLEKKLMSELRGAIVAGSAELLDSGPVTLRARDLPARERAEWKRRGVRSILLVALVAPVGSRSGLLMVASQRKYRFSKGAVRAYQTIVAQAALALENLRLVDEAREAGALKERQHMAHEIHDTLAQGFTSIVMNLEAAEGIRSSSYTQTQRYHLDQARSVARENLKEARRLVWSSRSESSRPEQLEELEEATLPEALEKLAARSSEESGIEIGAKVTGTPHPLPREVESALLRVAGEALTNIRKHARAGRAALTLSYMDDLVVLDVRDDGKGFDPRVPESDHTGSGAGYSGGFGLKSMRERVEGVGGKLSVESTPGEGTTVTVELTVTEDGATDEAAAGPETTRAVSERPPEQAAEETATVDPRANREESTRTTRETS